MSKKAETMLWLMGMWVFSAWGCVEAVGGHWMPLVYLKSQLIRSYKFIVGVVRL
jgi:hypothetical protein